MLAKPFTRISSLQASLGIAAAKVIISLFAKIAIHCVGLKLCAGVSGPLSLGMP